MFTSFFPSPRAFFTSACVWGLIAVLAWFFFFRDFGAYLGLPNPAADAAPVIGLAKFFSPAFIWFYIYYFTFCAAFAIFWHSYSPHPWFWWSVVGSMVIVFVIYINVEVSVAINDWYGSFFNLIQGALSKPGSVPARELYIELAQVTGVLLVSVTISVLNVFFTKHYLFRWRQAMNNFYTDNWQRLSKIEGASQRIQDDTKRFAEYSQDLGSNLISAVMTLIAFLPLLAGLSAKVSELPLIGAVPYSLVWVSILWAIFGTALLATIGIKLPGLEFKNQRVEAAYRKELVYGEDNPARAQPQTLRELFASLRKNYFTLYFNYLYFDVGRYLYLQSDAMLPFLVLIPSVAAGTITFGVFQQVRSAFGEVRDSMQYLVKSWPQIVEWLSIFKRLRAFEATLDGEPMDKIEQTVDPI
ncbi:MAG: peptide antibiotic transporter SbmA [Pseudomonadota bacterium]|nr:peptide antibiotic transporter SbmA [Pseudomonadota bacterium]